MSKWIKSRRLLVAAGIAIASWATFQSEGVASGEFLTDRIGVGSVLRLSHELEPELSGRFLFFQDGKPTSLAQIKVDQPYCRFISDDGQWLRHLAQNHPLVVKFKNVARARWFFEQGTELECQTPTSSQAFRESDFHRVLGRYFQVEKHSLSRPELAQWSGSGAL